MAAEVKSTILGMATGLLTNIVLGDILVAIMVAGFTGAASYVGHAVMKHIHLKYFKSKKK